MHRRGTSRKITHPTPVARSQVTACRATRSGREWCRRCTPLWPLPVLRRDMQSHTSRKEPAKGEPKYVYFVVFCRSYGTRANRTRGRTNTAPDGLGDGEPGSRKRRADEACVWAWRRRPVVDGNFFMRGWRPVVCVRQARSATPSRQRHAAALSSSSEIGTLSVVLFSRPRRRHTTSGVRPTSSYPFSSARSPGVGEELLIAVVVFAKSHALAFSCLPPAAHLYVRSRRNRAKRSH